MFANVCKVYNIMTDLSILFEMTIYVNYYPLSKYYSILCWKKAWNRKSENIRYMCFDYSFIYFPTGASDGY